MAIQIRTLREKNGSAFTIYEDTFEDIWFGVTTGAVKYSYTDSSFTSYSEHEGLVADCGSNVHDFAEDEQGNLYFATFEDGIYKMIRSNGIDNGKIVALGIRAWPNPAREYVNVSIPGFNRANITLSNMQGQQVLKRQVMGNARVNVNQLPKGVYLLTVEQKARDKKIVVE